MSATVISQRASWKSLGEDVVILDLDSGAYYTLSGTGADIWRWLAAGSTIDEVVAQVTARYRVDETKARDDTLELIQQLSAEKILETA